MIMPGYFGDKSTGIVHLLSEMTSECKIGKVKLKDREYFTPDTLANAESQDFSKCKWCIKQNTEGDLG